MRVSLDIVEPSGLPKGVADHIAAILTAEENIKAAKAKGSEWANALGDIRTTTKERTLAQYANTIAALVQGRMVRTGKRDNRYSAFFRAALVGKEMLSSKKASRLWDYAQLALTTDDKRFVGLAEAARAGAAAVLAYMNLVAKVHSETELKQAVLPDERSTEEKIANRYFKNLSPVERRILLQRLHDTVDVLPVPKTTGNETIGDRAFA